LIGRKPRRPQGDSCLCSNPLGQPTDSRRCRRNGNNLFTADSLDRRTGHCNDAGIRRRFTKPQRAIAYKDLAAGFQDYVRFLQANPRYDEALRAGGNADVYADRLQSSGYATDPRYAEKIRSIIASPIIDGVASALKTAGVVPNYL
jgi:flagellar protein FlgJ